MPSPLIIGGVFLFLIIIIVVIVLFAMGGETKNGPSPSPSPSPSRSPSQSPSGTKFIQSYLPTGATIFEPGQITSVASPNGQYNLDFQGDDNLCLNSPAGAKWCLMSQDVSNGTAYFQTDGNICVNGTGGPVCAMSQDLNVPDGQHRLVLKNDGTLYVDHGTGVAGRSLIA